MAEKLDLPVLPGPCQENMGKRAASPCSEHTCSTLLQPPARPFLEVRGQLPGAPPSWTTCSLEPDLPPHCGTRPAPPTSHGMCRAARGAAAQAAKAPSRASPAPAPCQRWPQPQQPRGIGMGTARESTGTWPVGLDQTKATVTFP